MDKSTVPVEHGFANPFLARASHLIANVAEFRDIVRDIQGLVREGGGRKNVNISALLGQCGDNGVKERLREAFLAYRAVPETPPVIGAPPPTKQLYGRFSLGVSIVDVGSGNGLKLKKFTGTLKITAVDPLLCIGGSPVLTPVKTDFLTYSASMHSDLLFTSFMSACQLTDNEQQILFQQDGLHLIPDHDLLLSSKVATLHGDKVMVRTPKGIFGDHRLPPGGLSLEPGYNLLPVYKAREIDVDLGDVSSLQSYKAVIDGRPAAFDELDLGDMGYKWDGIAWELELSDGQAVLVNRAGLQFIGTTNFKFHACLALEELDNCYVLIRIVAYRGMIPPHCGFSLRAFADRVRIAIKYKGGTKPVCGPPPWYVGKKPLINNPFGGVFEEKVDGVISRRNEKDYYCKYQWTIDIRDDKLERLRQLLKDHGMRLEGQLEPGLWEYGLNRDRDVVKLTTIRQRLDKTKETKMDTVLYLLKQPTLEERKVLE